MKARLLTIFTLLGLALTLIWVMTVQGTTQESNNAAPKNGSTPVTLNLNLGPADPTLDPALDAGGPSRLAVNQLFVGLTRVKDETGEVIPELATSWETSADATVLTFTLRNDITWTNGQTVTAHDVRYGILRSLDPATGAAWAGSLFVIQNAAEYNDGTITDPNQVGVTALDDTHIRFTLIQAAAYLPHILALPVARPMPQLAIEAHGVPTWTYPANIVSNGAYSLTAWTHGVSMTLHKNPNYYDAANVQIEQVTLNMVDNTTAWNLYRAGLLDSVLVPQTEWITATRSVTLAYELHVASTRGTNYYGFNTAKSPFTSTLVRQAFIAAVDRQGVISDVTRYAEQPALTFAPPGIWGHVDGIAENVGIPYSPTLAQQWLAAAGYPNGQGLPTVTLMYSMTALNQATAEYIRQNWMDNLGVTVVLSGTNRNTLNNLLRTNPPQVSRQGWSYDYYDAYDFLYEGIFSSPGGRTKFGNWNNPTYDALLSQAAQTADPNTRKALYKQAEKILVETDAIMLPLHYWGNGIAAKPYLQRTYGEGGWGGRVAEWRITRQVFLPIVMKN